jgi:hypothetical protein
MMTNRHIANMQDPSEPNKIFNPKRQRQNRQRRMTMLQRQADSDFLGDLMADDIIARLDVVTRSFSKAMIIGNCSDTLLDWLKERSIETAIIDMVPASAPAHRPNMPPYLICKEWDEIPDLPFQPDLIIMIGVLDAANDVPGLLVQLRRTLRPDGLLLAEFFGVGSLPLLKRAMLVADGDMPRPHIHPQIDVRSGGDLLSRAGFAMPVADIDMLSVRYRSVRQLLRDIRSFGGGYALTNKIVRYSKGQWALLNDYIASQADSDDRATENFALVSLSGWAPSPDQPKPAKRGSSTMSLASQLGKKPD